MAASTQPFLNMRAAHAPGAHPGIERGRWLALATDGPAVELMARVAPANLSVVSDPAGFRRLLLEEQPPVVVCASPPGGPADLELLTLERRRRPNMRVVVLTAADATTERLEALAMGLDEALPSTVSPDELAGRLLRLAAQVTSSLETSRRLWLGDGLELDLNAHQLQLDGRLIHLRPKEFGLLAELALNPGIVLTRRQLLDRVWGSSEAGPRTVDVHVRWLRSKIEADAGRPTRLVTVRSVGYRLDRPHR
jgi:DNA-binding response OmpR family regulator